MGGALALKMALLLVFIQAVIYALVSLYIDKMKKIGREIEESSAKLRALHKALVKEEI